MTAITIRTQVVLGVRVVNGSGWSSYLPYHNSNSCPRGDSSLLLMSSNKRDLDLSFQIRNRNEKRSTMLGAKLGFMAPPAKGPDYRSSHCAMAGQALDKQQTITRLSLIILASYTHSFPSPTTQKQLKQ